MAHLEVRDLSRHFGGLAAVDGLSFGVEDGEIRGPIGPNGAGKTTVFDVINGYHRPTAGDVVYRGETIADAEALEAEASERAPRGVKPGLARWAVLAPPGPCDERRLAAAALLLARPAVPTDDAGP